jgi:hypothetical protein
MIRVLSISISILIFCIVFFNISSADSLKVIASHLDNPRGLAFGNDEALYVAEAGRGGNGFCTPFELFGDQMCFGQTGAITRISNDTQQRIVQNLSSFAHHDGGFAFGPHDLSFRNDGNGYAVMGGCFGQQLAGGCGKLIQLQSNHGWKTFADIDSHEISHANPINNFGESNPFALLSLPNKFMVANAASNDLLRINLNASISKVAVFPKRKAKDPNNPGSLIEMDAVPSSVTAGPDGAIYVSELTGYPFPIGAARIYRIVPGKKPQIFATGFTNVIDIAFDHRGNFLILEFAKNSLRSKDLTGALIRLNTNGSRQVLMSKGLKMPTAIAVGSDDAIYISNCGACPGKGQVLRITTSTNN